MTTSSSGGETEKRDTAGQRSKPLFVAGIMLALVVAFYLLREHWGHALGLAPYLLLLACPLMHLMHGHGGHRHHERHDSERPSQGR